MIMTVEALQADSDIPSAAPAANSINKHMKNQISKIAVVIFCGLALAGGLRAAPTAADVGDAETFGHSALYMGATSGFETLAAVGRYMSFTDTNAVTSAKWR